MNNQEYHHCIPRSKVVEVFKLKVGIICAGIQRGQRAPRVPIALKNGVEKYSTNHSAQSHLVGVVPQVVIRVCVWVVIHTLLVACEESLKEYRRILSCWNFFYNIQYPPEYLELQEVATFSLDGDQGLRYPLEPSSCTSGR